MRRLIVETQLLLTIITFTWPAVRSECVLSLLVKIIEEARGEQVTNIAKVGQKCQKNKEIFYQRKQIYVYDTKCQNHNQVEDALEVKEVNKIGNNWKRALLRHEPQPVAQNSYLFHLFMKRSCFFSLKTGQQVSQFFALSSSHLYFFCWNFNIERYCWPMA